VPDHFSTDAVQQKADQVAALPGKTTTTELVKVCEEGLALLGNQPQLSDPPSNVELARLGSYCNYSFFFASMAFSAFYHDREFEQALVFGHRAIDAANLFMSMGLNSDSLAGSDVLNAGLRLGSSYLSLERFAEGRAVLEKVLDIAQRSQSDRNAPDYQWWLSCTYSLLLEVQYRLEPSETQPTDLIATGTKSLELLVSGAPSHYANPSYMVDQFDFTFGALYPLYRSDPTAYNDLLVKTIDGVKQLNHPAMAPVLAYLYSIGSAVQLEYGHVTEALAMSEAEFATRKNLERITSDTVGAMANLALCHSLSGNESGLLSQVEEMRNLIASDEALRSDFIVQCHLLGAQSSLAFIKQDAPNVRAALLPIVTSSELDLTHINQLRKYANALYVLAGLDKNNTSDYLLKMENVIEQAEELELDDELVTYRKWYALMEASATGLYWFDEPRSENVLPAVPGDLTPSAATDLQIMHEHAYIRGDFEIVNRVSAEMFRRGYSDRYLNSLYWIYNF
jgi:hypothetical protein